MNIGIKVILTAWLTLSTTAAFAGCVGSTAPGGGLSTAPGGGLSTAPGGGCSTAPGKNPDPWNRPNPDC